jgi:microcystin degradation protein MlrC
MWTGRSPYSDIIQRALVWEAQALDAYVSVFFGFPWSDVVNAGVTVQVTTNNDPGLAARIAEDMSAYIWRRREELFSLDFVDADKLAAPVARLTAEGKVPIVIADYSDRAGDATHVLAEVMRRNMSGVLLATIRDERLIDRLARRSAKPGDLIDEPVGGFAKTPASGSPVRLKGTLRFFAPPPLNWQDGNPATPVAVVEFGRGNLLMISSALKQIQKPEEVAFAKLDISKITTWVLKSRAHFRRGFDETGFAKSYLFAQPPVPYVGTIHLDALPYRNLDLKSLYPYRKAP